LTASGSRFKGISEASGGNSQTSPSNYPLVQLLSLTNEQTLFLLADATTGWSDTSFSSAPITLMTSSSSGFPIGYALVTVFTNGIPSRLASMDWRYQPLLAIFATKASMRDKQRIRGPVCLQMAATTC
jgi:hypothetical protein